MRDLKQTRHAARTSVLIAAVVATYAAHTQAAVRTWNGTTSTNFEIATNWSALPVSNDFADIGTFSGTPTANQPTLTVNRAIAGLDFQSGGWTLGGPTFKVDLRSINSTGSNTISSSVEIKYTGGVTVSAGETLEVTGTMIFNTNGGHSADKLGAGTLKLSGGLNVYSNTQPITALAGTIELNHTGGNPNFFFARSAGTIKLLKNEMINSGAGQYIVIDSGGTLDVNGKTETLATLYVGASNGLNYKGSAVNGTIGGLGGGTVALNNGTVIASGLQIKGGTITAVGGGKTRIGNGGVTSTADAATATINGTFGLNNSTNANGVTFTVADGAPAIDLALTGAIVTDAGTGKIAKTGAGTMTVSGSSTYVAGTTVSAGALYVNNASGSGTGTGAVVIAGGATLGGTGTIVGTTANITTTGTDAVTLARLAPGTIDSAGNNVIESLVIGSLAQTNNVTLGAFSALAIDFANDGLSNDVLNVFGTLSLDGSANGTRLLLSVPGTLTLPSYQLASYTSKSGSLNPANITGVPLGYEVQFNTNSLDLVSIPEPSALAVLGLGAAGLLRRRRAAV